MKFVCLGFIDETKFAEVTQEGQKMMEECFAYDDELRRGGHFLGGEALDVARKAVTLRMEGGKIDVTDGKIRPANEKINELIAVRSAAIAKEDRT